MKENKKKLNILLKARKALVRNGAGMAVLEINEMIAVLARRLGLDYYRIKN